MLQASVRPCKASIRSSRRSYAVAYEKCQVLCNSKVSICHLVGKYGPWYSTFALEGPSQGLRELFMNGTACTANAPQQLSIWSTHSMQLFTSSVPGIHLSRCSSRGVSGFSKTMFKTRRHQTRTPSCRRHCCALHPAGAGPGGRPGC